MSVEFRNETNINYEKKIELLLQDAPSYVRLFYNHMHGGKRELSTQHGYIRAVLDFIRFEHDIIPECSDFDLREFPAFVFDKLTIKDLNEYRDYLRSVRMVSNARRKYQLSGLSVFYKFLNAEGITKNNPFVHFEMPKTNKKHIVKLDAELSNQLLSGILRNDRYLAEAPSIDTNSSIPKYVEGQIPVPIPERVRLRREKTVLRNFAICSLFLGSGLRVSELVGLDLSDINFRQNSLTIIKKGGDETEVYFNDDVALILKSYINDTSLPRQIIEKYLFTEEHMYTWCERHCNDKDFVTKFREEFPNADELMLEEAQNLKFAMRSQGRHALGPRKNENAVFITTRGSRMTVRMVELMIKEMARTYIPEFEDIDLFSPHKLRATCATRILTQTGDIELAATQLNHSNIAVTAAFYAELKKEQKKDKIKSLDMQSW